MFDNLPKSSDADITLLLEGTFPFVAGGVSSWVYQLITQLPQYRFAGIFLGGTKSFYKKLCYPLPKNLVHLDVHFLFEPDEDDINTLTPSTKNILPEITDFHDVLLTKMGDGKIGKKLHDELFVKKTMDKATFLHSKSSWDYITEKYKVKCPEIIFSHYFWGIRNTHLAIWKLLKIVNSVIKTRLVHSISTGYAGFLGALLQYEKNYPFVLTEHGIYIKERRIDLLSQWSGMGAQSEQLKLISQEYITNLWIHFFDTLGRRTYSTANPIISLFKAYQEEQIKYGAPRERTLIIPNGVPIDKDAKPLKTTVSQKNPVIALIGRVVPIKDIKTFIRSMLIITKTLPDAKAWIIGPTDEDKEYFEECKAFVNVLKLTDNVEFLGQQKISDVLPKIDLNILSSISEGLPLVLLEGFAAGIPAVATNVGACSELIYGSTPEDQALGSSGIVVEISNADALGTAILELLQNPTRWHEAQEAGLARVKRYYSQAQVIEKYMEVYEKAF